MRNSRIVFLLAALAVGIAVLGLALSASAQASPVQWRIVTDGLENPGGGVYLTNAHSGYYMGRLYRRQMFGVHDYRGSRGFGARVTDDGRVYRWGRGLGDADGCFWIGPAGNGPPGDEYLGRVDGDNRAKACSRVHMNALAERTNFGRDFNCPANAAVGPQRTTLRRSASFHHNVAWHRDGERYRVEHVAGPRRAVLPAGTTVWYRYTTRDGSKAVVFARSADGEELGWGFVEADAVEPPSMRHWTLAGSWAPEWSCGTALEATGRHWRDTVGVARGAGAHLTDDNVATGRVLTHFDPLGGGRLVAGDFDGDGADEVAVYNAPNLRVLDAGGTGASAGTLVMGQAGDLPVVGDFDGDGKDTLGVYRLGVFHLSDNALAPGSTVYAVATRRFALGLPGDVPLAGRWSAGQRTDSPAVYRTPGLYVSVPQEGAVDPYAIAPGVVRYGALGDLPVVGDWDNKGYDSIGVYRSGTFMLRNTNTTGEPDSVFPYGIAGDLPLAGNWDGR